MPIIPTVTDTDYNCVGMVGGDALVEMTPFDRRVVGSNPIEPPCRDLGQVLHLQLPVALRRVNPDTVSIAVVRRASERLRL